YAYNLLTRYKNNNALKQIIKGKYTSKEDIYTIASNIYVPSYISFWTASYLKGYTEQIVTTVQIITTKNKKSIIFMDQKIEFYKFSKKLFFGFKKLKTNDGFMFLVEDEKLII